MTDNPQTTPWQPIDTSPKDGTCILGYAIDDADDTQPQIICWMINGDKHEREGWHIAWDASWWGSELGPFEPFTHWMPLPEPPKMKDAPTPQTTPEVIYEGAIGDLIDGPGAFEDGMKAGARAALINAWHIAKDGCLLPPDGGSPTEGDVAVSSRIANRIRAMMPDSKLPILGDEA